MSVTLQIEKMTIKEKLQTMEALWADLSRNAPDTVSPVWHETALKEMEDPTLRLCASAREHIA